MIINALNSGAFTFMADFEDSSAPTWDNSMEGQINLSDAINRTIDFVNEKGKPILLMKKRLFCWFVQEDFIYLKNILKLMVKELPDRLPILGFIFSEMQKTSGKWKWTLFLSPEIRTL
jgi:hypothetical protein